MLSLRDVYVCILELCLSMFPSSAGCGTVLKLKVEASRSSD